MVDASFSRQRQLQVVQDQLVAQKAETKKLSEQIAAAETPAPVAAPVSSPKLRLRRDSSL
jgi:hypothetical protein